MQDFLKGCGYNFDGFLTIQNRPEVGPSQCTDDVGGICDCEKNTPAEEEKVCGNYNVDDVLNKLKGSGFHDFRILPGGPESHNHDFSFPFSIQPQHQCEGCKRVGV